MIAVLALKPGDCVWAERKQRGVLGSRDRSYTVRTMPERSDNVVFFDAYEIRSGLTHRITVCTSADASFEVAE